MRLWADPALARRLEAGETRNALEYVAALARERPERGAAALEVMGGCACYAGAGSPITRATGLGMAGPVSAAEVDRLERFFRERGATPSVQLCPLADPSLVNHLAQRGYRLRGFLNVHARALAATEAGEALSAGVRVAPVDAERAAVWARTVTQGFQGSDTVAEEAMEIATMNWHTAGATCFLASIDGEPAGGGVVALYDRLALFYSASTRVAFRGRGVQTALLRARLSFAAAQGCDLAMVRTTPGSASQRNVERAGFQVVYTKVMLAGKPW